MIRFFDILFSLIILCLFIPFGILISILILIDSKGGVFFTQNRVGKNNMDFKLIKFRTMQQASESSGLLTVGSKDSRITKIGYYLRKFKIDEIPQIINVLKGDMSLVGPRPEVRKYVDKYSDYQKQVLNMKPGITDFASIEYFDENEILKKSENPEETYINEIMPHKIDLNLRFINNPNLKNYFLIIFKTIQRIIK